MLRAINWSEVPIISTIPEFGDKVFGVCEPTAYEIARKGGMGELIDYGPRVKRVSRARARKVIEGEDAVIHELLEEIKDLLTPSPEKEKIKSLAG